MRRPDLIRAQTKAWKLPASAQATPDQAATISAWVVNGPFHPFWSWWLISAIHLRDLPGVRPAHREFPEAGHEFIIVSLNPERGEPDIEAIERAEDWGDPSVARFLVPPDLVYQVGGISDEQAAQCLDLMVQAIIDGRMSPDQDYREAWKESIAGTLEHLASGQHSSATEE